MTPVERLAFSVAELATAYGCGKDLIYAEIRAGRIKATKLGTKTVIARSEALRFIDPSHDAVVVAEGTVQ